MNKQWYINIITMEYSGIFKWEGLPDGITSEQIEYQLFNKRNIAIIPFNDSWYAERYTIKGQPDIYDNPITIKMSSINNELKGVEYEGNPYYIYENSSKIIPLDQVNDIIRILISIHKDIINNIDFNKNILVVDNENRSKRGKKAITNVAIKDLEKRFKSGIAIFSTNELAIEDMKSLKEVMNDKSSMLWEAWFNYAALLWKTLGVAVNETNFKSAQINSDEIRNSNHLIENIVNDKLKQRENFIDRISIKHPEWSNVKVSINDDILKQNTTENIMNMNNDKGGENNEL